MKRLLLVFILMASMVFATEASAIELNEYGAPVLNDGFEQAYAITGYPYLTYVNGAAANGVSAYDTSTVFDGSYSVCINTASLGEGDCVSFARSFYSTGANPTRELYYVSFYVKGEGLTKEDIDFYYTYNLSARGAYTDYGFEAANSNGWHKVWFTIPITASFNSKESSYVGLSYKKRANGPNSIYVDRLSMVTIPAQIRLSDRTVSSTGEFDLTKVSGRCFNPFGDNRSLVNTKYISWTLLSGNAEINGSTLSYNLPAGSKIRLLGDFFGAKSEITLTVSDAAARPPAMPALSASEITCTDSVYSSYVTNSGNAEGSATLILAVYDEDRLFEVKAYTANIPAGSAATVSSAALSDYEFTPTVRAFVWDKLFGCIRLQTH